MGVVKFPTGSLGFHALLKHTGKENRRGPQARTTTTCHPARSTKIKLYHRLLLCALLVSLPSPSPMTTAAHTAIPMATFPAGARRRYLCGVLSFASHGIHDVSGEKSVFWRVTGGRRGGAFHPLPLNTNALCIASYNPITAFLLSMAPSYCGS